MLTSLRYNKKVAWSILLFIFVIYFINSRNNEIIEQIFRTDFLMIKIFNLIFIFNVSLSFISKFRERIKLFNLVFSQYKRHKFTPPSFNFENSCLTKEFTQTISAKSF